MIVIRDELLRLRGILRSRVDEEDDLEDETELAQKPARASAARSPRAEWSSQAQVTGGDDLDPPLLTARERLQLPTHSEN